MRIYMHVCIYGTVLKKKNMRYLKRNLEKLNSLLQLNHEMKTIYEMASHIALGAELEALLERYSFQRSEFSNDLKAQILDMGGKPSIQDRLSSVNNQFLDVINRLVMDNEVDKILRHICNIEQMSIDNYNNFLQELHIPVSVCKLLIGQRDDFQNNISIIETKEVLEA